MADQGRGGLLSPWLRRRRFAQALPYVRGRVLDIGCGVGLLAEHVAPDLYVGMDTDLAARRVAEASFPEHRFVAELPEQGSFDTIVALAVIEHLPDPEASLATWARLLAPEGRIVATTPHPSFVWVHEAGAAIGIFSHEAAEEHHRFFDGETIRRTGEAAGLKLARSTRFLLGANQLFVLTAAADGTIVGET